MSGQAHQMDDNTLFDKIREGDTKAFECAFKKFAPRLEAFARKYTNDAEEAEDIVQESFLKLWERRELLENISLASFLFMMVRNGSLNFLKHRQVADSVECRTPDTEETEQLYAIDFAPDPSAVMIQQELSKTIDSIMDDLPPKCKEAFMLSRLKGMKNREIAEYMNITEKVVEKHITRALKRFKDGLEQYLTIFITFI